MEESHQNRLIHEKSLYLQQIGFHPIDWYPWCDQAFAEAVKRDVPVFLSIGSTDSPWCQAMAEECFIDEKLAEVLNENFVSVHVDREELPEIDRLYQSASSAMTGQGGWPLNCFLDHQRHPFFTGTYFPKGNFKSIICSVTSLWTHERAALIEVGLEVIQHIRSHQQQDRTLP